MEAHVASQPLEPGREGIGGDLVGLPLTAVTGPEGRFELP